MACTHLTQLYKLCQENKLSFSSSDLVRIVCKECESEEVCPSALVYGSSDETRDDSSAEKSSSA